MATTKIWPVKDSLKRLVDYAENPEKTGADDLKPVLEYAENGEKTESFFYVTGINCNAETAYEEMKSVKRHFGKTDGNVAYHGYQSFRPGEVTPEECHAIGVELANRMWGDKFQVIVATHLDRDHLHNHFLLNSVSFVDGRKFNDNRNAYYNMRDLSDELCREHGLSVIEKPKGKTPRSIYFAEKKGEPTRFNLMRKAIDTALRSARNAKQFESVLRSQGYKFNFNPNRKYATIREIGSKKAVRLHRLGEEYDIPEISRRLDMNRRYACGSPYRSYVGRLGKQFNKKLLHIKAPAPSRKIGGLKGLYLHYCYLLGYLPKGTKRVPLSPEMKAAWRKIDKISDQVRLICRHHLNSNEDVEAFVKATEAAMNTITKERNGIYNKLRRETDPDNIVALKRERDTCTSKLKQLRKELKTAKAILPDSVTMKEQIAKEEQVMTMQRDMAEELIKERESERSR